MVREGNGRGGEAWARERCCREGVEAEGVRPVVDVTIESIALEKKSGKSG